MNKPLTIVMIEDDEGHARLIERNFRRAGVTNDIVHFSDGASSYTYFNGLQTKPAALSPHSCASRPQFAGCFRH